MRKKDKFNIICLQLWVSSLQFFVHKKRFHSGTGQIYMQRNASRSSYNSNLSLRHEWKTTTTIKLYSRIDWLFFVILREKKNVQKTSSFSTINFFFVQNDFFIPEMTVWLEGLRAGFKWLNWCGLKLNLYIQHDNTFSLKKIIIKHRIKKVQS